MTYYHQFKPALSLADYIECYWVCRAPESFLNESERLIPGGRIELIFNFGDPMKWLISNEDENGIPINNGQVMGQRDRLYFARQCGNADLLGVRFKPGGFSAFSNLPVSSLLNQVVPAEYLLGSELKDWECRLMEQKSPGTRIQLLDQLLTGKLKYRATAWWPVSQTVERIRKQNQNISVDELCNESGWYYKKMERAFLQFVGYTPKYYYRIVRFNRALRQVYFHKNSLTSICYECGYYDQSHFIKDFRQFAGTTPKHFEKGRK